MYKFVLQISLATTPYLFSLIPGDLASGLYGSTQFLTEHGIRVIAVGIDKEPHYEFLQSVASYRDVSNVFSVNSDNLVDAAPYMYRDVCNSKFFFIVYSYTFNA